jgi:hypothetical protein
MFEATPLHPPGNRAPVALVFWVIWAALIAGVVVIQLTIGGGIPRGDNRPTTESNPFVIVCVVQILAATAVRWLVLPRCAVVAQRLVAMIVGLALSEGAAFFGMFLVARDQPETRLALLILALLGMAQFAPFYARAKPAASFH